MHQRISEYTTFFSEFRRTFSTTGAVAPSGRVLARALVGPLSRHQCPARILEVGPGTGAVTREIVRHVEPDDRLDIVELNDRFVEMLRHRFASEPDFRKVASQTEILHMAVQDLPADGSYDYIVCGLPFNNFSADLVRSIFRRLLLFLRPGGTLSFFEYLAIRRLKTLLTSGRERRRIAQVGGILQRYLRRHECDRNTVYLNLPPAIAHHLCAEELHSKAGLPHDAVDD